MARNATPGRGTLIVTVLADPDSDAESASRAALQVVELSLAGDGARVALVRERAIDLVLEAKAGVSFAISAPAGRWQTLALALRQTRNDAKTLKAELPVNLDLQPGALTTLRLGVNVEAANKEWRDLRDLLRVLPPVQAD